MAGDGAVLDVLSVSSMLADTHLPTNELVVADPTESDILACQKDQPHVQALLWWAFPRYVFFPICGFSVDTPNFIDGFENSTPIPPPVVTVKNLLPRPTWESFDASISSAPNTRFTTTEIFGACRVFLCASMRTDIWGLFGAEGNACQGL